MANQATAEAKAPAAEALSPEVIEAAKKLLEKRNKAVEKAKENVAKNYPYANAETLTFDEQANKNKVEVTCVKCGKKHWRYTSDLKQTKGICPSCKKDADKVAKKEKKALLERAMKAIADGKI